MGTAPHDQGQKDDQAGSKSGQAKTNSRAGNRRMTQHVTVSPCIWTQSFQEGIGEGSIRIK